MNNASQMEWKAYLLSTWVISMVSPLQQDFDTLPCKQYTIDGDRSCVPYDLVNELQTQKEREKKWRQ